MLQTYAVCSDPHGGPLDHPATDMTPGWVEECEKQRHPVLVLGDGLELLQFKIGAIWAGAPRVWRYLRRAMFEGRMVAGNHDKLLMKLWGAPRELRKGDTIFLHGDRFDPWPVKVVGGPVSWLVGKLEFRWPDIDVRLGTWAQKTFQGGRHGNAQRYIKKAAAYARKRGARQIVMGHLHTVFNVWLGGTHIICTGSCVNGNLDFIEIHVEVGE